MLSFCITGSVSSSLTSGGSPEIGTRERSKDIWILSSGTGGSTSKSRIIGYSIGDISTPNHSTAPVFWIRFYISSEGHPLVIGDEVVSCSERSTGCYRLGLGEFCNWKSSCHTHWFFGAYVLASIPVCFGYIGSSHFIVAGFVLHNTEPRLIELCISRNTDESIWAITWRSETCSIGVGYLERLELGSGSGDSIGCRKHSDIWTGSFGDIDTYSGGLSRYEGSGCEEDSELFADGTDDTSGVVGGCGMGLWKYILWESEREFLGIVLFEEGKELGFVFLLVYDVGVVGII